MLTHIIRSSRTCKSFIWMVAGLWLALEASITLDATFHIPVIRTLLAHLPLPTHITLWLLQLKLTTWPLVSLVLIMALREEAVRWFSGHSTCRMADRLTTAWFAFVGTLFIIDHLTPAITVVWTVGAKSATLWLFFTRVASITSRTAHATHRRSLRRYLKRWPLVRWFSLSADLLATRLRTSKGVEYHELSPHAHSHSQRRVR